MGWRNYSIKAGYKPRRENPPYIDTPPSTIVYQPHVYEFVKYLVEKVGFKYVIDIGAGNGEKLQGLPKDVKVFAIDYAPNLKVLRKNLPKASIIDFNLEKGVPSFSNEVLKNAVVVSSDVIEHIREPHNYLKGMARIAKLAPYVLISTPDRTRARGPEDYGPPGNPFHVREWSIDELHALFKSYGINNHIGHTTSNTVDMFKGTSLAISGTAAKPPDNLKADKSVLAIMCVYNEADIIEQSVMHLLQQGVAVHVIDNWSTDQTMTIAQRLAKEHEYVTHEQFPAQKPKKHQYEWTKLLRRVEEVAAKSEADWIIHNDADEFRQSPWPGLTLQQALSYVSLCGYNAVDFTVIDFRPVRDGYDGSVPPDEFFYDFEFTKLKGYFIQVKGWQYKGRVDLGGSGGHVAEFPDRKTFPLKFVSRHYPLRSKKQAGQKIFKDRVYVKDERAQGWHIQYDKYSKNDSFLWNPDYLNKFTPAFFYAEYMVELLSGVGLQQEE
jgi:glycosyltransferase involved in cell wall biosynthesis